jgi:hypothetical protein
MAGRKKARTGLGDRDNRVGRPEFASECADRDTRAPRSVTVRVPLALNKRGGRKLIVSPNGGPGWWPPKPFVDNTVVKALARAHRWKRMIESGRYGSLSPSSRMPRRSTLAILAVSSA